MTVLRKWGGWLALAIFFSGLAVLFFPKERLLNLFLSQMQKQHISLCSQSRACDMLGCELKGVQVAVGGMPVAQVATLRIGLKGVLLYRLKPLNMLKEAFDYRLKEGYFNPYSGRIEAVGSFGELTGRLDWWRRRVILTVTPSPRLQREKELRQWMRFDGKRYRYESAF